MNKIGALLFLTACTLSLLGIFILFDSSLYSANLSIGDKYYFFKNQLLWFVIGSSLCFGVSRIDYKKYYKLALPILLFTLFLLVLVFFPGIGLELKGANRWLNLGLIVVQPSEMLKVSLTIYLAAWLSNKEKGRLIPFLMLLGLAVFLVILEPDLGTAFIIASCAIVVYFLSGASVRDMLLILILTICGLLALAVISPYRLERLTAFKNFDSNNIKGISSYHTKQGLVAIGSGGLFGLGFGNSIQKYAYLPEHTTDSIFAIFAEEAGFIGSVFLICGFVGLLVLGFFISASAHDTFGRLLAGGIISYISIQVLVNIASIVVLVPLTGVPLPFISYGGSSLVINFLAIGILLNIARKK